MVSAGKLRGVCEDLRDSCGASAGSSALRVQLCAQAHVLQHQMVRTSIDGKLSLGDLIKELLKTDADNAWHHMQRLIKKGLVPPHEKVVLSRGPPSHVVTAAEWEEIKTHLQHIKPGGRDQPILYAVQYSNVWDCVKVGRCKDINERLRTLCVGHNFGIKLLASFPGYGHLERRVHERLAAFQSTDGSGTERFNVPGSYALKIINEVIVQSHRESPSSSSESEQ